MKIFVTLSSKMAERWPTARGQSIFSKQRFRLRTQEQKDILKITPVYRQKCEPIPNLVAMFSDEQYLIELHIPPAVS